MGGYVLAGGKSSRMGRDKAMLELAGKPLVGHAVKKLRRICEQVHILSDRGELARYAPLVADVHPSCGPMGGIEAALRHSPFDWNLILPVDVPFLPTAFLDAWVRRSAGRERRGMRLSMFATEGIPQPTLLLAHKELLPFLSEAVERGEFKLLPVLEAAGGELAKRHEVSAAQAFRILPWIEGNSFEGVVQGPLKGPLLQDWQRTTEAQQRAQPLWFANLNTPQDFAAAEEHAEALDT